MPSFRLLTLIPLTVQLPPVTVAGTELVEWPAPSLATTETESPGVTVPLAVVFAALAIVTGLVTTLTATVGATVFFVVVCVLVSVLPAASVAVAV